jgi:tetratricopeptide (TPR) repeat protein
MATTPNIPKRQLTKQLKTPQSTFQKPRIDALLNQGLAFHQRGQLKDAQNIYENILKIQSMHFDALQLLGVLFAQQNCYKKAVELIGKALKINPNHVIANNNLGIALRELKQLDVAMHHFNKAVNLDPNYLEALQNLANVQFELRLFDLAIRSFDKLIQIKCNDASAHNQRGIALMELSQFDQALESYKMAISIQPDMVEAHNNRGIALQKLGKFEVAMASFDEAIRLKPDYAEAYCNRGIVLQALMKGEEAIASFEIAIHLRPDYAEAYNNLGNIFQDLKQFEHAMVYRDKALSLQPNFEEAMYNKASLLFLLNKVDSAIELFDKVLDSKPNYSNAWWNKSLALLAKGNLDFGWPLFEWRYLAVKGLDKRFFNQPRWTGAESLIDKVILLYSEQGLGDTIQFCRYTKLVCNLGARVILEVPKPLTALLGNLEGVFQLVEQGDDLPAFDYHCPLMSLPLAFQTNLESIPAPISYIQSLQFKVTLWQNRLGKKIKPRIGLVWSGNPEHKNDQNRSVSLTEWIPWLPDGYEYISLQKLLSSKDRIILDENPGIISFTDDLNDFVDTAGLVECLDLVISVDTSVAHLSGALGKQTWILLPFTPDWRWMLERSDSPWYPSVKLYRQQVIDDWASVFKKIKIDLLNKEALILGC